jgi:8-oxo-dGTP pyrophosphatase MutT (NUDIX family)
LGNKIVFLKQFKHGKREYKIELPGGFSEKCLTMQENAKLEIYEELGSAAGKNGVFRKRQLNLYL